MKSRSLYRGRRQMPHIALVDGFWRVTNSKVGLAAQLKRGSASDWLLARYFCHHRNVKEGRSEL